MNSIMAKWEELPIADRAQYMRIAVQNGYRDIRSIREAYNRYAEGGPKGGPENGYEAWLRKEAELNSKIWGVSYNEALKQMKNDRSYNYEKFYELQKANPNNPEYQRDFEGNAHYNDIGKSVYHPTASIYSYYSGKKDPKWNPTGAKFGEWLDNNHEYRLSDDMLRAGANPYETFDYLGFNEVEGVRLRDERGRMFRDYREPEETYIDRVLPEVIITGKKKHSNGGNLFETGGPKGTKKVGPTYNPKTKTWTNSKGQNITGKSFKGKYGTTTYLASGAVDLDASAVSGKYDDHRWRYASNAPRVYIGGTTNEARQKYFDTDTELTNTVKTMAKKYGISPNVLASRIAKEGPIDEAIKNYNNTNGYFQRGDMIGPVWGLDDMGTWITNGKVKLRKGLMVDADYEMENEKGRTTYSVGSDNYMDGVELTAVALKYFKDQMRQRYPKASEAQLEQYATAAFNTGMTGAINLINKGKIKDAYKPFIKVKKNGGYIRKLLTKPN